MTRQEIEDLEQQEYVNNWYRKKREKKVLRKVYFLWAEFHIKEAFRYVIMAVKGGA